jgi:hypothetical protein
MTGPHHEGAGQVRRPLGRGQPCRVSNAARVPQRANDPNRMAFGTQPGHRCQGDVGNDVAATTTTSSTTRRHGHHQHRSLIRRHRSAQRRRERRAQRAAKSYDAVLLVGEQEIAHVVGVRRNRPRRRKSRRTRPRPREAWLTGELAKTGSTRDDPAAPATSALQRQHEVEQGAHASESLAPSPGAR